MSGLRRCRGKPMLSSDPWDALVRELDAWGAVGQVATFWWRDDDATVPTPALDMIIDRAERFGVPLCLAVIPAAADARLAARLAEPTLVCVAQHGYAHRNWAAPGAKKIELGSERAIADMVAELAAGRDGLAALFGKLSRPILVPPWNRIAGTLLAHLPGLGFVGLSSHGATALPGLPERLRQANTHADPVDWHGTRGFAGEAAALSPILAHLQARRLGDADPIAPTGLLTHHTVEDVAGARFAEQLLSTTVNHPAARWLNAEAIFECGPDA